MKLIGLCRAFHGCCRSMYGQQHFNNGSWRQVLIARTIVQDACCAIHRFDQLPSNTVTALEVWLLACMLLVFLSLVEYAVILRQIVIYKR